LERYRISSMWVPETLQCRACASGGSAGQGTVTRVSGGPTPVGIRRRSQLPPLHPPGDRHIFGMDPVLHRVDRPKPHLLQRAVIQLTAVVFASTICSQNCKIKSAYQRSCWVMHRRPPDGSVSTGSGPAPLDATRSTVIDFGDGDTLSLPGLPPDRRRSVNGQKRAVGGPAAVPRGCPAVPRCGEQWLISLRQR
jgi:hypothetical protein